MAVVEDPRFDRTKSNDLEDILVLSVLAVLCGADGWEEIELFANIRFSWLKTLELKGVSSRWSASTTCTSGEPSGP